MIRPKFLFIFADILMAYCSLILAFYIRFPGGNRIDMVLDEGLFRVLCFVGAVIFMAYFSELYDIQKFAEWKFIFRRTLMANMAAFVILSAIFYLLPGFQFGRGLLLIALVLFGAGQAGLRFTHRRFSRTTRFARRILIVGVGDLALKIEKVIPADLNPHSFVGFVSSNNKGSAEAPADRIVGDIKELGNLIHDYRPHQLIIALTDRRGALPLKEIMHSKLRGIEIFDAPTYYEQQTGCLLVEDVQPSAFIYTQGFRMTHFMRSYKRLFDLLFSTIGLILAVPIVPLVALAIKLDSPGPLIYKQLRVGEREVEYFVYKFRSMRQDAESSSGAVWAQKDDPRVTKTGKFLRKTRLDELPQLYNVLKGDMSFIGPRPERFAFVERLKETIPYYSTRHFIKPGITGWAQVCYPYGASDEDALEKLRYDLFYIKNYSIFLDFRIIIDTVRVVTSGFGGR